MGATTNQSIFVDEKLAIEEDLGFDLVCPVEEAIQFKFNIAPEDDKQVRAAISTIKKQVFNNTIRWFKDNQPLNRPNGNPYIRQLKGGKRAWSMLSIGTSDEGQYECRLNYTGTPKKLTELFHLAPSIIFRLRVQPKSVIAPDKKPTISHPPTEIWGNSGKNVTFTCNRIDTLSHQTTFWFKSQPFCNNSCEDRFMATYNKAERAFDLKEYFIESNLNQDTLTLNNVTDKDIGHYGCLVENNRGSDKRLGYLNLHDSRMNNNPPFLPWKPDKLHDESRSSRISFDYSWLIIGLISFILIAIGSVRLYKKMCKKSPKKEGQTNLITAESDYEKVGHITKERQHLPNGNGPDIYNVGKNDDGFISGHLFRAGNGDLPQSICNQMLEKGKNPSISSTTNSDEASWSSNGDSSRLTYLHTSNTTATTMALYDHPPTAGLTQFSKGTLHEACVVNYSYGILQPDNEVARWGFPRRNLERLEKIGEGQFGEVWRYLARQTDGRESLVAVKQLKNRAGLGDRERLELLAEIDIMKSVDSHPNIIKLLHYCADSEPILLIMEYAENGKLQTYLRNCRSARKVYCQYDDSTPNITSKDLITFSYHIAKGMEYVASQGIVHRDLASRNILVSRDKVCKVADFGFARRVTDDCAYERTSANPVPVKWMAPEALVENKFTSKSDVFSLGILMWEIVTLGATPYEYLTSSEVYKKVTMGGRLDRPTHCKDEFYNIMAQCWLQNPTHRPTFKELSNQLEKLLLSDTDYIELDQYPEHAYYNILNTAEKEVVILTP